MPNSGKGFYKMLPMQEDLRGEVLEKTLGKYLGESN
jgi:hypothetical protein